MFLEIEESHRYGYVRVSSESQEENSSIDFQTQTLMEKGIPKKNIHVEISTATDSETDSMKDRKVFSKLIDTVLKKDDLLVVTKLDRCSRNTLSFLQLQKYFSKNSINFVALDLPYTSDLASNKLIGTMLSAIATFENDRRKERQRQGIAAAKKAGKYKGRKTVINKKLIEEVQDLKEKKNLPVTKIALLTGKCKATIYKVLKEELGYVSNRLVKNIKK